MQQFCVDCTEGFMPCLIDNSSTADVFCCTAHSLVDQTVHLFWIYWNVAHRTVPVAPELYNVASKMLSCTEVRLWLYMDPQEYLHMFLRDNTVLLCSSCQRQPVTLHQRKFESIQKRLSVKKRIVSTEEHSERIGDVLCHAGKMAGVDGEDGKHEYCLLALEHLVERVQAYSSGCEPVQWGWCRSVLPLTRDHTVVPAHSTVIESQLIIVQ